MCFCTVTSQVAKEIAKYFGLTADVIHIDAAHEYEAVIADIKAWWPRVRPGGILLGDDWNLGWQGVDKAVREFAHIVNLTVEEHNHKWLFRKPL